MAEHNRETPEELFELGKRFYLPGEAGAADPDLALFYFQKAAEAGFAPAQRVLGSCCLEGRLSPPDFEKARHWLTLAARQGDGQAAYALALMYAEGMGLERDLGLAWKLLNMECARKLTAARLLKENMKAALARPFESLGSALEAREKTRRALYDGRRKRFIQPWFAPGRPRLENEEFEIWLKLTSGEIGPEEGRTEMERLLDLYYDQEEAALTAAGSPPGPPSGPGG